MSRHGSISLIGRLTACNQLLMRTRLKGRVTPAFFVSARERYSLPGALYYRLVSSNRQDNVNKLLR